MKTKIVMLLVLVTLQVFIVNKTHASGGNPPAPPTTTIVDHKSGYGPGTAISGASGSCVKDWDKQMQKCVAWSMVNPEDEDPVHAFGGGVTFRVDTFAVHIFGGVEDIEGDDTTLLITGSVNWR